MLCVCLWACLLRLNYTTATASGQGLASTDSFWFIVYRVVHHLVPGVIPLTIKVITLTVKVITLTIKVITPFLQVL